MMRNPFDQNFFRFLLGFSFILATSFTILFIVTSLNASLDEQEAQVFSSTNDKDPGNRLKIDKK